MVKESWKETCPVLLSMLYMLMDKHCLGLTVSKCWYVILMRHQPILPLCFRVPSLALCLLKLGQYWQNKPKELGQIGYINYMELIYPQHYKHHKTVCIFDGVYTVCNSNYPPGMVSTVWFWAAEILDISVMIHVNNDVCYMSILMWQPMHSNRTPDMDTVFRISITLCISVITVICVQNTYKKHP